MVINTVNPSKTHTAKTLDNKSTRVMYGFQRFPSPDVDLCSRKRVFRLGATTTVVEDSRSKPTPLRHVETVQSLSLSDVDKQKKIFFKVKSAKNCIAELFRPTGRIFCAVTCTVPFAISDIAHSMPDHGPSIPTSSFILRDARCKVVTETLPSCHSTSETTISPTACSDIDDEQIENFTSAVWSRAEASSPSFTAQPFMDLEAPLDRLSSTSCFLRRLQTIKEEDNNSEVIVGSVNMEQQKRATFDAHVPQSNSDSEITVSSSSDTHSDCSTTHEVGSDNSVINTPFADSSFATSVDADDTHRLSPGMLRGLRRVPNYENLRNIAIRGFLRSEVSYESSEYDSSPGAAPNLNTEYHHKTR